jgi:hypothetical protein
VGPELACRLDAWFFDVQNRFLVDPASVEAGIPFATVETQLSHRIWCPSGLQQMLNGSSNLDVAKVLAPSHRVAGGLAGRGDASFSRRSRLSPPDVVPEEVLVVDERHGQSPARAVEQRLAHLMKGASLPASMLQVKSMLKER